MKRILVALVALLFIAACGPESGGGGGIAGPTPGADGFSVDRLTRDHGCGFGFAAADEAETVRLVLTQGNTGEDDQQVRDPDRIGENGWTGRLDFGEHVMANWCVDLIMDPQASIEETWELVEGTLEFPDGPPLREFDHRADTGVRATLVDAVAVAPDGTRHDLDTIELENHAWGFFAG